MALKARNYDPALMAGAELETGNIPASTVVTADIAANAVTGAKMSPGAGYFMAAIDTDNTTAARSVFGPSGLGTAIEILGCFATAMDATATTVTLDNYAGTVIGTMTLSTKDGTATTIGVGSLANTSVVSGGNLEIVGNGDGQAMVFVTYKFD